MLKKKIKKSSDSAGLDRAFIGIPKILSSEKNNDAFKTKARDISDDVKRKKLETKPINKQIEVKSLDIPLNYTGIARYRNHKVKYFKGRIHRISGPAIEYGDLTYEFWLNGHKVEWKVWLEHYKANVAENKESKEYIKEINKLKEDCTKLKEQNDKLNNELNKIYGKPAEKVDYEKSMENRFKGMEVD